MIKSQQAVMLFLISVFLSNAVWAKTPVFKPGNPIEISIAPTSEVVLGETVTFEVTVVSKIASDQLRIVIQPPGGMTLQSGDLMWRGAVQAGVAKTISFSSVFSRLRSPHITALAMIKNPGGASYSNRAIYQLVKNVSQKPQAKGRVIDRNGKPVYEIKLK